MKSLQQIIEDLYKMYGNIDTVVEVLLAADSLYRLSKPKSFIASETESEAGTSKVGVSGDESERERKLRSLITRIHSVSVAGDDIMEKSIAARLASETESEAGTSKVGASGEESERERKLRSLIKRTHTVSVAGDDKETSIAARLASGELQWLTKRRRTERVWIRMPRLVREEATPAEREGLIDRLKRDGGRRFEMILEKSLFMSDVAQNNNRLSMPRNRLLRLPVSFLTAEELAQANSANGLTVVTVDEQEREYTNMKLKMWNMGAVRIYNLLTDWFKLVVNNGLEQGDSVQVWSFLNNDGQLRIAVFRV